MFDSIRVAPVGRGSVLVLGYFQGEGLDRQSKAHDAGGALSAALKRGEATGDAGKITEAFPEGKGAPSRVILVGLGKKEKFEAGSLRNVAAAVGRRLAATKDAAVMVDLAWAGAGGWWALPPGARAGCRWSV